MVAYQEDSTRRSITTTGVIALMNLWVYPALTLWTLVGILVFPFLFGLGLGILRWPPDRLVRWFIWAYGRGWLVIMSPFVRFRREGMENLRAGQPGLLIVNHFSFFDTYCMALLPLYDIVFAVRSWPFRLFWYRGFMRLARYLDVEGSSWETTLHSSQRTFQEKGAVLFFPEGHRSRNGEVQRFYSGGFKVAIESGVPLLPLCIDGTNKLLPPGRKLFHPCTITLRALTPIDTTEFRDQDGHIRLRKLAKQRIVTALSEMRRR